MTKTIDEIFERRWEIMTRQGKEKPIKDIAFKFFRAGWMLAQSYNDEENLSSVGFEEFWSVYDKKVSKEKCKKLWNKLTKKEQNDCMIYIPKYKMAQPQKQYRKNPDTFLRNKSWNDELIYQSDNGDHDKVRTILGI